MALTAAQQTEMDKLKQMVADHELSIRRDYPASFASNGKMFFELWQALNAQMKNIEQA